METVLIATHVMSWCIYVGGAICMELVLRHAQVFMRPSQIAVVCQNSGMKYRWWSLGCLILLLGTGLLLAQKHPDSFDAETTRGLITIGLCLLWVVQISILALLSFRIHPDMHLRVSPTMTADEVQAERQRVGAAIVQMDITVRVELGCALLAMLAGTSLRLV
jgi:uncharacterized membrane protein